MTTVDARSLSVLMDDLRRRGSGSWSSVQRPDAPPAVLAAAWASSDDPVAMLLLLAALHPHRDLAVCGALVTAMSFFPPMREEAEKQARSRAGMHYDGPARFRFLHLAQRMRTTLADLTGAERSAVAAPLCDAMRKVVDDPYAVEHETSESTSRS